jgi:hypothetical protein
MEAHDLLEATTNTTIYKRLELGPISRRTLARTPKADERTPAGWGREARARAFERKEAN